MSTLFPNGSMIGVGSVILLGGLKCCVSSVTDAPSAMFPQGRFSYTIEGNSHEFTMGADSFLSGIMSGFITYDRAWEVEFDICEVF